MARGLNKVQLIGRLGTDPKVRTTRDGVQVASFAIATNRRWKDKDGTARSETEWHPVVAWGKLADTCGAYLHKGRMVYVEGRIRTRSWAVDDRIQYRTEVLATELLILDRDVTQQVPPAHQTLAAGTLTNRHVTVQAGAPSGSAGEDELPF